MTRIVILGDSLAMPRQKGNIPYEKSYPFLLTSHLQNSKRNNLTEVIVRNRRANTTTQQVEEHNLNDDLRWLKPDIVVLHFGIVDCAPRLFTLTERKVLNKMPLQIRKKIIEKASNNRLMLTKKRPITYVKHKQYKKNISKLINESFKIGAKIIVIDIAASFARNYARSFNLEKNIQTYSSILQTLCLEYQIPLITVPNPQQMLLDDGVHLNISGQQYIAKQLYETLPKL